MLGVIDVEDNTALDEAGSAVEVSGSTPPTAVVEEEVDNDGLEVELIDEVPGVDKAMVGKVAVAQMPDAKVTTWEATSGPQAWIAQSLMPNWKSGLLQRHDSVSDGQPRLPNLALTPA